MHDRIVILSPTREEIEPFAKRVNFEQVNICSIDICGVGMAEMACSTYHAITKLNPSLVILAGIAGSYPQSELVVGDVALVETERIADLGAIRPAGFLAMYEKTYNCPYTDRFKMFKTASSYTVNTAASPFVEPCRADIENMEGAAFFSICLGAGVPFLEMRAVSNTVSADRKSWNIPVATENLSNELFNLISVISKTY